MPKSIIAKTAARKPANSKPVPLKLTDAQLKVLSSAASRSDGAATRPDRTSGKAAEKLAAALTEKRLVREIKAKADMPVWRRNEDGRDSALIISSAGREAIKGFHDSRPNDAGPGSADAGPSPLSKGATASAPNPGAPRAGSKIGEVIALLSRSEGAGIEDLMSATGWLSHTTRAALTGLRKRGFAIERERSEQGGSVYRIVPAKEPAVA
jgi:hypothetical protein